MTDLISEMILFCGDGDAIGKFYLLRRESLRFCFLTLLRPNWEN